MIQGADRKEGTRMVQFRAPSEYYSVIEVVTEILNNKVMNVGGGDKIYYADVLKLAIESMARGSASIDILGRSFKIADLLKEELQDLMGSYDDVITRKFMSREIKKYLKRKLEESLTDIIAHVTKEDEFECRCLEGQIRTLTYEGEDSEGDGYDGFGIRKDESGNLVPVTRLDEMGNPIPPEYSGKSLNEMTSSPYYVKCRQIHDEDKAYDFGSSSYMTEDIKEYAWAIITCRDKFKNPVVTPDKETFKDIEDMIIQDIGTARLNSLKLIDRYQYSLILNGIRRDIEDIMTYKLRDILNDARMEEDLKNKDKR